MNIRDMTKQWAAERGVVRLWKCPGMPAFVHHPPGGSVVKDPPATAGDARGAGSNPGSGRSPGGGKWQFTPVFLSGKSHGQRSLAGYLVHGIAKSGA